MSSSLHEKLLNAAKEKNVSLVKDNLDKGARVSFSDWVIILKFFSCFNLNYKHNLKPLNSST